VIVSKDFATWTDPVLAFTVDLRDDAASLARVEQVRPVLDRPDDPRLMRTEYYGIGAYQAESCTLAFPWILTVNNNARWGNHEGPQEIQLAVSRDLVHWSGRSARRSSASASWTSGTPPTTRRLPRRCGSRMKSGSTIPGELHARHAGGLPHDVRGRPADGAQGPLPRRHRLATWPLDRFVSADAGSDGGTLTTVPVRFGGGRLEVNAATKPGGRVVVELLDAAGRALPGFPKSEPVTGDKLRHTVCFPGHGDVSALIGKAVVLRFTMQNASLYSFAFRAGAAATALPRRARGSPRSNRSRSSAWATASPASTTTRAAAVRTPRWCRWRSAGRCRTRRIGRQRRHQRNSTVDALKRLDRDVLAHRPQLVTVMFA